MAEFIVISTNSRLHYLVDDMQKCRPLNPSVSCGISTGKISQTESGHYTYGYSIHGEKARDNQKAEDLSSLIANQLAEFRLRYSCSAERMVNIFLLENPLNEHEYEDLLEWQYELETLYNHGRGSDTSFCVFHVLFTYDLNAPSDVNSKISNSILQEILNKHRECTGGNVASFSQYVFYIDNQKRDAAALCLDKRDHDLKMPRFLLDFMMLASNVDDSYGVLNSIKSPSTSSRCFAVGYAESMYYYPDVERYFCLADMRDLHSYLLSTEDETNSLTESQAMDVERYPLGLQQRLQRLQPKYEEVPFTEDIENYPSSVDKTIDDCLVELHDSINEKREEERKLYEAEMSGETDEEERERLIKAFEPRCPEYVDRCMVYQESQYSDSEGEDINKQVGRYHQLLDFVSSKDFAKYIKSKEANKVSEADGDEQEVVEPIDQEQPQSQRKGCLGFLFFWKKQPENPAEPDETESNTSAASPVQRTLTETVQELCKQLKLKRQYAAFKADVKRIESSLEKEDKDCEEFELTTHANHYYPLIDIEALKEHHRQTAHARHEGVLKKWQSSSPRNLSQLLTLTEKAAKDYAQKNLAFIKWDAPSPIVARVDNDTLPAICNELQKKSAPFVNYNVESEEKEDKIVCALYSDRDDFHSEIEGVKKHVVNGNAIASYHSTHIASKICMMQFLPMDDDILENLVDLHNTDADGILDNVGSVDAQEPMAPQPSTSVLAQTGTQSKKMEDWGDIQP